MMDTKVKYTANILDKFFAHSIDILCILSRDGLFIKVNPEWENVLGYKGTETEGFHYTDFVHPDDIGKTLEAFTSVLNNERLESFINRYKHKNGSYLWIEWKAFAAENLLFASARDITNQIETTRKLKESEEQYRILNEISGDFILKVALSQNNVFSLVYASENLSKHFNRVALDIQDYDLWLKYFHKDDITFFLEYLLRLIEGASTESYECRLKINGEYRWFNFIGKPERDMVSNRVIYIIFAIKDITDIKTSQKNVAKSEDMLRSFFNESSEGILIVNEGGKIVEWNKSASRITGISKKEIINKSWWDLNEKLRTPESDTQIDKKIIEENVREILKTGKFNIPIHSEFSIKLKNGEYRFIESRLFVIKSEKAYKLAQIFTNISDRKEAEDEILKLNKNLEKKVEERTQMLNDVVKDLEAFTYSISHDLRAPVRHIEGFIRLLTAKINQPSEAVTGYLNKVKDATLRMSVMIDSLLTFSRLGRKELTFTNINTETLIKEIIDEFKPDTENRHITWKILSIPIIQGDKNAIKIAFENLISNAIKYTSKKPAAIIEVGGNTTGNFTEIYVKDNGIGFDMNYSNKLFGVFQRLHSSDNFEGIGIGLANVKQIIDKHKGFVRAESKLDEGATFFIKLPNK